MEKLNANCVGCDVKGLRTSDVGATRGKYSDFLTVTIVVGIIALFIISPAAWDSFGEVNRSHGMIMGFVKFAILATFGELLSLRLTEGVYLKPGWGLLPKAFVWGFLGLMIKASLIVFSAGVKELLAYLGLTTTSSSFLITAIVAFSISLLINIFFAPILMILHKMFDIHIASTDGTMLGLFSSFDGGELLKKIDWDVMWNFVFKKTIPFFWIPVHTITFLLPPEYQVGFAALLGIVLGVILAFAGTEKCFQ